MKRFRKFLCLFLGVVVMMSYTNVAAQELQNADIEAISCLLYTSDAADD